MNKAISHIILNDKRITSTDISALIAEKLNKRSAPDWEKELYLFLNEWFSDSDFVLAQTSGSTGEPKSIELPKSLMVKSAERTIRYFGLKKNDRFLLSLSCRYIAGRMMVVRAIVGQMNLVAVDPAGDFDFLAHKLFDFGAMVPNQVLKVLQQPSGKEKLENIRNLLVGGSALPSAFEAQINRLGNRIVSTYGMTETASHIAIRELSGERKSDGYHCLPGIAISLSEDRRLQIHLPELNEIVQTNDIAELLSATSFRIHARADSVLISGGIKYSPEAIENKLDGVMNSRFVISSLPDKMLGEKLVLVIEGKHAPAERIQQKIKDLLPPFEQPKSIVFLETFPETDTGKLNRNKIKQAIQTQQKQ